MKTSRRALLFGIGGAVGAGVGALCLPSRVRGQTERALRPPGAGTETEFLGACIRCGQCVQVCPDDTLWLQSLTAGVAAGAPTFDARAVPCSLCAGLPEMLCIEACPSGALRPLADRVDVRIGTAVIDRDTCLAYNDATCRACWHACPYPGTAIGFDARLRPVVGADACVGCGLCVYACLTEPTSIEVVPPSEPAGVPAGEPAGEPASEPTAGEGR